MRDQGSEAETKQKALNSANPTDPAPNAVTSLTEVSKRLTTSLIQSQTVTNNRFLQMERTMQNHFQRRNAGWDRNRGPQDQRLPIPIDPPNMVNEENLS